MLTILLAWIDAKYKARYELLFLGILFVDFTIITFACLLIGGVSK